MKMAEAW